LLKSGGRILVGACKQYAFLKLKQDASTVFPDASTLFPDASTLNIDCLLALLVTIFFYYHNTKLVYNWYLSYEL